MENNLIAIGIAEYILQLGPEVNAICSPEVNAAWDIAEKLGVWGLVSENVTLALLLETGVEVDA